MSIPAIVVVGQGWVGRRLVDALRDVDVAASGWSPTRVPNGAKRTASLLKLLDRSPDTVVVNAAGRTRGTLAELVDANVTFPTWLAELLNEAGSRLVHLGSAAEYGATTSDEPIREDATAHPSTDYGRTKLDGTLSVLGRGHPGSTIVLRPFNLVGPGAPPGSPVAEFAAAIEALDSSGGSVEVRWPATVRDFTTVGQLATSLVGLLSADEHPPIVNVCSGVGVRFDAVIQALGRRIGRQVVVASLRRPGIPSVVGDPTVLGRFAGSIPVALGADGVARAVWPDVTVQYAD